MDNPFVLHCCELLAAAGPCRARRMFGGWGLSVDGMNLAIVAWDTLFLKTDALTEPDFLAQGCRPFVYEAKGKAMRLHYHTPPEEALDSPALMAPWAQRALAAALRAQAAKTTKASQPSPRKRSQKQSKLSPPDAD